MLIVVVSDFLCLSFLICMIVKRKMQKYNRNRTSLSSPLCAWMPAIRLHSRKLQQWPNDPSKSIVVSLSFYLRSHDLHLMTPVSYSHHLLCFYFLPDLCLSHLSLFLYTTLHPSQFDFLLHHLIFLYFFSHIWSSELQNTVKISTSEPHTLKVKV